VQSTVAKRRPLECPKAVGEDTDEVGSYRLDVPPAAQTRCCEGIIVKGIQEIGDAAPLSGNGSEYLFAIRHRLGVADADAPQGGVTRQDQRVPDADLLKDVLRNPLLTDDAPGQHIRSGFVVTYLSGPNAFGE
jgi:hypothetical protein